MRSDQIFFPSNEYSQSVINLVSYGFSLRTSLCLVAAFTQIQVSWHIPQIQRSTQLSGYLTEDG